MDTTKLREAYDRISDRLMPKLAADIIVRKFAKQGISVTSALRLRLQKWIAGGAKGDFRLPDTASDRKTLEVTFTARDYRRLQGRFGKTITDQLSEMMVRAVFSEARATLKKVRRDWRRESSREERSERSFHRRLVTRWRVPLDLLKLQVHLAREHGGELNDHLRQQRRRIASLVEVLTGLHARCCQIAGEVVALIAAGYADGAMARWRSLHEVSIVLQFIAEHGNETAQRYIDHTAVESCRAAKQYMLHCAKLGYVPYSAAELKRFEQDRDAVVAKHGKAFATDYGWAAKALNHPAPKFTDIEKGTGLDHWRPFYKLASHGVHANPKGMIFKLGLIKDTLLLPVGPTNYGFADPGQNAALSLGQATAAFLVQSPTPERLLAIQVMTELSGEIGVAFLRVQQRMQRAP